MAFIAGALLYQKSVRIAELYSSLGDWLAIRDKAPGTNVLQSKIRSTAKSSTGGH